MRFQANRSAVACWLIGIGFFGALACSDAWAQKTPPNSVSAPADVRGETVEFEPIWQGLTKFKTANDGMRVRIENGKKVPEGHFPTLFRKRKNIRCTLTVIGPRAAIAAAHCFSYSVVRVRFVLLGVKVSGKCYQYPGYHGSNNPSVDWALCKFDNQVPLKQYEALNVSRKVPIGQTVVLMGYGCTQIGGPLKTQLHMGKARVSDRPSNQTPEPSTIYARGDVSGGEVALCEGDSGGPTFLFEGSTLGPRQMIGVNSRVLRLDGGLRYSYVSATGSEVGRRWIKNWRKSKKVSICGIDLPAHKRPCNGF